MRATIGDAIGINGGSEEIDLLERRIGALNSKMMAMVSEAVRGGKDIESNEDEFKSISDEIDQLKKRIKAIQIQLNTDESYASRLSQIEEMIEQRLMNIDEYDDTIVRQMIECIKVYHDGRVEIIFGGGYIINETIDGE